ncbi:kinesin-like protein KIN-14C [Apium graveolens]|uniref:kinesin-like protein KIN-14C n=1 Tax=Apium graveolens TaxID=4045 RepID=UPI003D7B7B54
MNRKDVLESTSPKYEMQRAALIEWLNTTLSDVKLPVHSSDDELRGLLLDGSVLCRLLNKLRPGSVSELRGSDRPSKLGVENVERFLVAIDQMALPRFQVLDLQKGSLKIVVDCLFSLRAHFIANVGGHDLHTTAKAYPTGNGSSIRSKPIVDQYGLGDSSPCGENHIPTILEEQKQKGASNSQYQHAELNPVMSQHSTTLPHHAGHKFHEVFQHRHGHLTDLPPAKLSEMINTASLDNAPTQSLLSLMNGILDESIERKNSDIPGRVACLLRKVIQEIERRMSTQAEHIRTLNNLFRAREERYQSRIRVLEALASGTNEEAQFAKNQSQFIKVDKSMVEEKRKVEEQDVERLIKQTDNNHNEIAFLRQELGTAKRNYEQLRLQIRTETKETNEFALLKQELETLKKNYAELSLQVDAEAKGANDILCLKQDLKITKKNHELHCLRMETEAIGVQQELAERLEEVGQKLADSRKRVEDLEAYAESRNDQLTKKENICKTMIEFQLGALQELKNSSQAIRHQIATIPESYLEDFNHLGAKLKALEKAANNYYDVLDENRKLHNEVQDLKGSIRVYCRIRPFIPGQMVTQSIVEYVGENGEVIVVDRSKQGKEGPRSFKFNKVYGPAATQVDVYSDTQPLIRSVLDGYNVCIFAYGQTGSGKTYTMIGPDGASEENWGVNYRALNDLFQISQKRDGIYTYEIAVQMVEIYNEQVRDLLTSGGILTASQPSGLAVPDASMRPVQSTSDVVDLMEIGLKNRAKSVTSMNERSSRSHSILTIHARGTDVKTGSFLRGSLHLVDLAGSERIDRSQATGDTLKEAQHINKSLSALGDVISSLAQKSAHIPYRNSKLTQVLQSSLGGQAKTLMFIQLNPELTSFSESLSTLKFAERVSGVELGAARSSKEGRDVRELMEQVTSLKDTIIKKDEEIEQLQLIKDQKNNSQGVNGEKRTAESTKNGSLASVQKSTSATPLRSSNVTSGRSLISASNRGSSPENSTKISSVSPQRSLDSKPPKASLRNSRSAGESRAKNSSLSPQRSLDNKDNKASLRHSRSVGENVGQNLSTDVGNIQISDSEGEGGLSDGSVERKIQKTPDRAMRPKSSNRIPRAIPKPITTKPANDAAKKSTGQVKTPSGNSLGSKSSRGWQ